MEASVLEALSRRLGWTSAPAKLRTIFGPPAGVTMLPIRPSGREVVKAELARSDGELKSKGGALGYRKGRHYIVSYPNGDRASVDRRVFERIYRQCDDGMFEKRSDVVLHYFTLPYAVLVNTMEGVRRAEPGDWIVRGVLNELYPVAAATALDKYTRA
jgi:hypothetical protein